MAAVGTKTDYTPEDLLSMPDGDRYELVDGQLVERDMGFRAGRISGKLFGIINAFCESNQAGWLLPSEVGYQCFPDAPAKVRKPDVSFIRRGRLSAEEEPEGFCRISPDLAIEVVSPNDLFEEVVEKVDEYLAAGVQLVWVVDPATRTVYVYRADGSGTILRMGDELSGETVLEGFRCRIAEIFALPAGAANG